MENKKVYAVILHTSYECGDESDCYDMLIGVYSTKELAINAGKKYLNDEFFYDEEGCHYYDNLNDDAWVDIREYDLDLLVDPDKYGKQLVKQILYREDGDEK